MRPPGPRSASVAALPLALALAALVAAPAPAAAYDAVLTYQVRLGGFDVAEGEFALDLPEGIGDGAYRLRSSVVAGGLLGTFTAFTSESGTTGRLDEGSAAPQAFRSDSTWRGEARLAAVTWPPEAGSAAPQAVVQPPPEADERDPIPPRLTEGSIDPLSAVLHLVAAVARDGSVDRPVTVYDGRRLYRLSVDALAETDVEAAAFRGAGWRADVRYETLGGTSRKWKNNRREVAADVLLAPGDAFGLDVPVPLRVTVPTPGLGALVVELTAARPGGV
ncbi:DUF3108 domain-containing protein [Caenispirillum bisanense]|uniref:DUF3108 domain-containing protein n=1 Tax=Caenispirillum bisanense TaxID=414052 RepID=UPI0031DCA3E5